MQTLWKFFLRPRERRCSRGPGVYSCVCVCVWKSENPERFELVKGGCGNFGKQRTRLTSSARPPVGYRDHYGLIQVPIAQGLKTKPAGSQNSFSTTQVGITSSNYTPGVFNDATVSCFPKPAFCCRAQPAPSGRWPLNVGSCCIITCPA